MINFIKRSIGRELKLYPNKRVKNLLRFFDSNYLHAAHRKLRAGDKAMGIDCLTSKDYEQHLGIQPKELALMISIGKYNPYPNKKIFIPKANGELRGLSISCHSDKIVQYIVNIILCSIFQHELSDNLHGYIAQKGTRTAVRSLCKSLSEDWVKFILIADIKGFFDEISHDIIISLLSQKIGDDAFIKLVSNILKAGEMRQNTKGVWEYIPSTKGVGQGSICSPILANMYINEALMKWADTNACNLRGKWKIVSYADDFLVLFETKDDAELFLKSVRKQLARFGLQTNDSKTRIVPLIETITFLGFNIRKDNNRIYIRTKKKSFNRAISDISTFLNNQDGLLSKDNWDLLRSKVIGHYNYFGVSGNERMLLAFYDAVIGCLRHHLQANNINVVSVRIYAMQHGILPPNSENYWVFN